MSEKGYAFAVASVRAKENEFPPASFFAQLADSDCDACLSMLADKGILSEGCADPDKELGGYILRGYEYLSEITPEKEALDFLIVKNDFHNIKAALKSVITETDPEENFLRPSVIDPAVISDAVKEKKFYDIPAPLCDIAEEAYNLLVSTMDGQLLDLYLDSASLAESIRLAKESGNIFATGLAQITAACANAKTALRLSRGRVNGEILKNAFCECDGFDVRALAVEVAKGQENTVTFLSNGVLSGLMEGYDGSARANTEFERRCDNFILDYIRAASAYSFSAEPLIAYYIRTENTAKMLRIILGCKRNGLPREYLNERMRDF